MRRWEDILLWSFVLYYLYQRRNEDILFDLSYCSNDLLWCYGGYSDGRNENYTYKSMYIQIFFVGNGRYGDNLCSSEVVYWSISISTGVYKFALVISTALITCSGALADIPMEWMKTHMYRYQEEAFYPAPWRARALNPRLPTLLILSGNSVPVSY